VPENDHGDPGNMNFHRVIQLAKGEPPAPAKKYHTVVGGDTLYGIAAKYKTTVARLRALNPRYVTDSNIGIGDKVRYL
jgi:LysM repeat protein